MKAKRLPNRKRVGLHAILAVMIVSVGLSISFRIYNHLTDKTCREKILFTGAIGSTSYSDIYSVCIATDELTQLTRLPSDDSSPSWSPDGNFILFHSTRDSDHLVDGPEQIYVMDADGQNQRRLSYDGLNNSFPVWSPDGSKVLYFSLSADFKTTSVRVVNFDGSNEHEVIQFPAYARRGMWLPDGKQIAFVSDGNIFTAHLDGASLEQITHNPPASFTDSEATLSPDGAKFAYRYNYQIYTVDVDGRNNQVIAEGSEPVWSPDSTMIAFVGSNQVLSISSVDGSWQKSLSASGSRITWSPDGKKLAFSNAVDHYGRNIFLINGDGTNLRALAPHLKGMSYLDWKS